MADFHAGNHVRVFFKKTKRPGKRQHKTKTQHVFGQSRTETQNGTNPPNFWEVPRPRNIFQENEKTMKAPARKQKAQHVFGQSRTETRNGTNPPIFWEVPKPRNNFQEKDRESANVKNKNAARFWAKWER